MPSCHHQPTSGDSGGRIRPGGGAGLEQSATADPRRGLLAGLDLGLGRWLGGYCLGRLGLGSRLLRHNGSGKYSQGLES